MPSALAPRRIVSLGRRAARVTRAAAVLAAAGVVFSTVAPAAAYASEGSPAAAQDAAQDAASQHASSQQAGPQQAASPQAAPQQTDDRVVVVGTGGVSWADISAEATPATWEVAEQGGVGNLVVRSVRSTTCPADGWLALSSGKRAADYRGEGVDPCRVLTNPTDADPTSVPGWDEYESAVESQSYGAAIGSLGDAVQTAGLAATAIGPGAMIALATSDGTVAGDVVPLPVGTRPVPRADALRLDVAAALETSRLVVVDAGSVRDIVDPAQPTELTRSEQHAADVATVDGHLAAVMEAVLADDPDLERTTVVVASMADPGRTSRMGTLVVLGDGTPVGTLMSHSTRQPGYVQTTDLLPLVAAPLGLRDVLPRSTLVGTAPTSDASGAPVSERVDALVDAEDHARSTYPLVGTFFTLFCVVNLLLFATVGLAFSRWLGAAGARGRSARPAAGRRGIDSAAARLTARPRGSLAVLRAAAVAVAAVPVATMLANLVPWWRVSAPSLALAGLVVAWVAVVTAAAVLPPWKRQVFGPAAVVAAVTAGVLAVDVATGARLQVSGLMGIQPMVAGRFYGFNNTSFALFATSTIVLAASIGDALIRRGHRRWAVVSIATTGVVAVLLNGSPSIGADFGGPPATVPAFCLLALVAAGVRVTWRKVLAVLAAGVVVVSLFAVVDWLRPPDQRTHLGAFVDDTLDGELWGILLRKIGANFSTLSNPLTLVAVGGILLVVIVVGRPLRAATVADGADAYAWLTRGTPLKQVSDAAPLFVPAVVCAVVALVIGTLVNDSGIVILAVGMSVLVPVVTATYATWMLGLQREHTLQVPGQV